MNTYYENYNEESNEEYFLEVDVQYPEKLNKLRNDLTFSPERMKLQKSKGLLLIYMIELNMSFS